MRKDTDSASHSNVIEAPIVQRQTTVSEIVRARRIECALDIDHVAEVLRIRPSILTAIEDGNFTLLPGPAYAIGFVRSYATYLGLDAETIVQRFKAEAAEVSNRPNLHFPLPIHDSRVPTGPLLVICVLLAILTYAGWYYFNAKPGQLADIVPSVPDRLHHLLDPPVLRAPAPPSAETPAPAPTQMAAQQPDVRPVDPARSPATPDRPGNPTSGVAAGPVIDGVPPVETVPATPPVVTANAAPDMAQPVTVGPEPTPGPSTAFGGPDGQSRVVLRANADSWIQVRDKASTLLFTRVLKPGEHYNVPNQPGLTLIAGNAGGLDITVDGMNAPKIGDAGRVARNVSLDPDRLLAGRPHAN
jgi:cytoskeleton protein RodZ